MRRTKLSSFKAKGFSGLSFLLNGTRKQLILAADWECQWEESRSPNEKLKESYFPSFFTGNLQKPLIRFRNFCQMELALISNLESERQRELKLITWSKMHHGAVLPLSRVGCEAKILCGRSIIPKNGSNQPSFIKIRDLALGYEFVSYLDIPLRAAVLIHFRTLQGRVSL